MKNNDPIKWFYEQASTALRFVKRYPEWRGMSNRLFELEGEALSILHFFGHEEYKKACRIKRAFYTKSHQIIIENQNKWRKEK